MPIMKQHDDAETFMTFIPHIHISPPALANSDDCDRLRRDVSLSFVPLKYAPQDCLVRLITCTEHR